MDKPKTLWSLQVQEIMQQPLPLSHSFSRGGQSPGDGAGIRETRRFD